MRILTLSYEFPPIGGGGAKVVDGLARHLNGHEVDIVTMGFQDLPGTETVDGINIHRLPSGRKRADICHTHEMLPYLVSAFPKVKQLLAERKYDINHTHFIFPDGVLAWMLHRSTGLHYVITAHGSDVPGYNPNRFQFQHTLLATLWKRVVENAECVICPSAHLQGLLQKHSRTVRSAIIPNGMFADKFNPQREKRMRVLVVSRMFERKGVQYLLESLKDRTLNCEINIVGDGPYLDTLKRMAADTRTDIRFWGWLDNNSDELRKLYETSSIFVFTSKQENFPVNLLEAMTAGMAIITSEDGGSREVVGDTALQVKADQPEQFYATLQRLVQAPVQCEVLGKRARQRLESHFTWPTIAGKYQSLFDKVLG
ncbi:MAG: glycosyltransferase family 4 protein [Gammaproteobacteria bacterium]